MDGVCAETTEAQLRALRPDLLPDPIGKERQPVPGNPWDDSVTEGRDLPGRCCRCHRHNGTTCLRTLQADNAFHRQFLIILLGHLYFLGKPKARLAASGATTPSARGSLRFFGEVGHMKDALHGRLKWSLTAASTILSSMFVVILEAQH